MNGPIAALTVVKVAPPLGLQLAGAVAEAVPVQTTLPEFTTGAELAEFRLML